MAPAETDSCTDVAGFRCTERAGCRRVTPRRGSRVFVSAWPADWPARTNRGRRPTELRRPEGPGGALIVCGLPGDDEHRKLFAASVEKLHKALAERCGFAAGEILVRFGVASRPGDGPALAGTRGLSTREGIAADVDELRKRLRPEDTLWVIVLGHGHYDGRHSHLNIPGPDLDEREFARLFQGLAAREQVFWITTSASGFFLKPLSAAGRIVITATEPDQEVNETLFPLSLADAPRLASRRHRPRQGRADLGLRAVPGGRRRRDEEVRRCRGPADRARPARRQRRWPRQRDPGGLSAAGARRPGRLRSRRPRSPR